jgi:hypothetical protein
MELAHDIFQVLVLPMLKFWVLFQQCSWGGGVVCPSVFDIFLGIHNIVTAPTIKAIIIIWMGLMRFL